MLSGARADPRADEPTEGPDGCLLQLLVEGGLVRLTEVSLDALRQDRSYLPALHQDRHSLVDRPSLSIRKCAPFPPTFRYCAKVEAAVELFVW